MKKQFAVSAAILVAMGAISANAQSTKESKIDFNDIYECVKENYINEGDCKLWDILDLLTGCLPNTPDWELPDINLPDFIIPDNKPETEKPDEEAPETNIPEIEIPDADIPDTDIPDTDIPENDTPVIPEEKPEETPETDGDSSGNISESSYVNEVLRLVNSERTANGLSPVTLDTALCSAADVRAKEIKTSFSHTRPDGTSCFTVLSELGIGYNGAGENIAYGQDSPAEVMNAWMNSEGHRANILNSSFTKLGVGVYSSGGTLYWAQMFTY